MQLPVGPECKIFFLYYLVIPFIHLLSRAKLARITEFLISLMIFVVGILVAKKGSLQNILLAIPAGIFSLIITIILTSPDMGVIKASLLQIGNFPEKIKKHPAKALRVLVASAQEELIWRAAFVYLAENIWTDRFYIVLAGTTLFYLVHLPAMRPVIFIAHFEFILFTLFLYLIFLQTGSIIAVTIIHFLRNIYIMLIMQSKPASD